MLALTAALMVAAGGPGAEAGDVAALERVWSGVRDSSEQVVMSLERGAAMWPQSSERRVRTIVAPVDIAWLGAHVLYLEEFIEDDPQQPRRQLLLQLVLLVLQLLLFFLLRQVVVVVAIVIRQDDLTAGGRAGGRLRCVMLQRDADNDGENGDDGRRGEKHRAHGRDPSRGLS